MARRQPIEAFLLLVAERAVELLEHGLDGLHRLEHRSEPLLHGFQPDHRRERLVSWAIRFQEIDGLGGRVLELLERGALRFIGLHGPFDLRDDPGCALPQTCVRSRRDC